MNNTIADASAIVETVDTPVSRRTQLTGRCIHPDACCDRQKVPYIVEYLMPLINLYIVHRARDSLKSFWSQDMVHCVATGPPQKDFLCEI